MIHTDESAKHLERIDRLIKFLETKIDERKKLSRQIDSTSDDLYQYQLRYRAIQRTIELIFDELAAEQALLAQIACEQTFKEKQEVIQ